MVAWMQPCMQPLLQPVSYRSTSESATALGLEAIIQVLLGAGDRVVGCKAGYARTNTLRGIVPHLSYMFVLAVVAFGAFKD